MLAAAWLVLGIGMGLGLYDSQITVEACRECLPGTNWSAVQIS
jgi:hypothetical protein